MTRFLKKPKTEIGLSPDELVFRGEQKIDEVVLRFIDFDSNNLTEDATKTIKEISEYQEKNTVTWLNVDGLHNRSIMEDISAFFKLDACVIPEVLNVQSRPRVVEYDNCILITLKKK
jgi:magnesium transporter